MKLRHLLAAAALGAVCALLATVALGARSSLRLGPFFAVMTGKNEVGQSGRKGAGDRNGRGGATAVIDGRQFCWGIAVKNLDVPIAAHVHRARQGKNGDIVIPLTQPSSGDPGVASGCETISSSLAGAIRKHPSRYYFNVHTRRFPAGAIRGQIFAKHE